jgi:hypothetical protein
MGFGQELKQLVLSEVGSLNGNDFQRAMKQDHQLAMEYVARLLRRTVNHNGPVKKARNRLPQYRGRFRHRMSAFKEGNEADIAITHFDLSMFPPIGFLNPGRPAYRHCKERPPSSPRPRRNGKARSVIAPRSDDN